MELNGWEKYQELVLYKLKENTDAVKEVAKTVNTMQGNVTELKVDVSALKVKAAVAGGVAGMVGTGLVTAVLAAFK